MVYTFSKQNRFGKRGELDIQEYLLDESDKHQGRTTVEILPFDAQFPNRGDLLVKNKKRRIVEVKTDRFISSNFFLETMSSLEDNKAGCIKSSKSDYLVYYFINEGQSYIFKTKELQNFLERVKDTAICKKWNVANKSYTTQGVTIPKRIVLQYVKRYKFEDIIKAVA